MLRDSELPKRRTKDRDSIRRTERTALTDLRQNEVERARGAFREKIFLRIKL